MNVNYLNSNDHKDVKSIIKLFGFEQIIAKPTRITQSTSSLIDIIATNKPATIKTTDVIPTSVSDHDMVGCVRKVNNFKFNSRTIKCQIYLNTTS